MVGKEMFRVKGVLSRRDLMFLGGRWNSYFRGGPRRPLMCRESVETYPPFFLEDFLSGTDNR